MSTDVRFKDVMPPVVRPWANNADLPPGAIPVVTYKAFQNLIKKWSSGKLDDTLVVLGSAGVGKTESALHAIGRSPHLYLKGQATRYGVYLKLLEHIDEPVILDDVDVLLNNKEVTGLLKMLLETRSPRTIQWTTGGTLNPDAGIPASFATRSRTMIIANQLSQVSKNFSAVLDRATIVWFAPSPAEIHRYVSTWFKDKVVYEFVGERLHATPSPSCRFYYHGQKWRAAGLSWQKMLTDQMLPSEGKAMKILDLDRRFPTGKERVAAWREETGETEQAYWATRRAVLLRLGQRSERGKAISEAMRRKHANRKAAQEAAPAL